MYPRKNQQSVRGIYKGSKSLMAMRQWDGKNIIPWDHFPDFIFDSDPMSHEISPPCSLQHQCFFGNHYQRYSKLGYLQLANHLFQSQPSTVHLRFLFFASLHGSNHLCSGTSHGRQTMSNWHRDTAKSFSDDAVFFRAMQSCF